MSMGPGRPRKACGTCKDQKIRCTEERPSCKRCVRLKHPCTYSEVLRATRAKRARKPIDTGRSPLSNHLSNSCIRSLPAFEASDSAELYPSPVDRELPGDEPYLGIPTSLIASLVKSYFENVYQANLLFHRTLFDEAVSKKSLRSHIILSVCALGAVFYPGDAGQATPKHNGLMVEWARKAGRHVLQEIEDLEEENVSTLFNLSLFWHSQGSWKKAFLYKGFASQLLHVSGLGREALRSRNLSAELRRRRFWVCYIMHCHGSERLSLFEPAANANLLPLPWPHNDFQMGRYNGPDVFLTSNSTGGGEFAECIKALTLWSSVVHSIQIHKQSSDFSAKITDIHLLDEQISNWWKMVPQEYKLTTSNVEIIPLESLPPILLTNLVYHQCLCALHSSIVPLFGWGQGDNDFPLARQMSAQIAFDHACEVSVLIDSLLSSYPRLSALPSFLAYTAYSGCAIQIPFMWSSNLTIKQRAYSNVRANTKMINTLACYWRFAALLQIHVRCLFDVHKKRQIILENEPKHLDISKLTSFRVTSTHAQASILEFTGFLRSREDGYVNAGEEVNDLGIRDNDDQVSQERDEAQDSDSILPDLAQARNRTGLGFFWSSIPDIQPLFPQDRTEGQQTSMRHKDGLAPRTPSDGQNPEPQPICTAFNPNTIGNLLDPFFNAELLDFFPDGHLDFSQFENNSFDLGFLEAE